MASAVLLQKVYLFQTLDYFAPIRKGHAVELLWGVLFAIIFHVRVLLKLDLLALYTPHSKSLGYESLPPPRQISGTRGSQTQVPHSRQNDLLVNLLHHFQHGIISAHRADKYDANLAWRQRSVH
jgi:hypothetical protein